MKKNGWTAGGGLDLTVQKCEPSSSSRAYKMTERRKKRILSKKGGALLCDGKLIMSRSPPPLINGMNQVSFPNMNHA